MKWFSWASQNFSIAQIEAYFKQQVKPRISLQYESFDDYMLS